MANWRDLFELDIDDPDLRAKVEGFMDYFEDAEFPFQQQDPNTGAITTQTLTGQQVLSGIEARLKMYEDAGLTTVLSDPNTAVRLGMAGQEGLLDAGESIMVDGKFVIRSHGDEFDGSPQTGSHTVSINMPGMSEPLVLGISLGEEYLRGARYFGVDGATHPVTVEGVLANELAHMDQGALAEDASILLESIVTVVNGGPQREPGNSYIDFEPDANGGYQTLRTYEAPVEPAAPETDVPKVEQEVSPLR
jgi:hypothetical protein